MIHHHFKEIDSTNDWAKEQLPSFSQDEITLVTADSQLKGRGRYGRHWVSPTGMNFCGSFCFFVEDMEQDPLAFTHVMAISITRLLQELKIESQIKWPNDILVDNKKIGGILCETIPCSGQFGVVIGVGLNVNTPQEILDTIEQPATSCLVEKGKCISLKEIQSGLESLFTKDLALYLKRGFEPFLPTFKEKIVPGNRAL